MKTVAITLVSGVTFFGLPATICAQPAVTYYRDVAGILQNHCQQCHRPGEIGPMPLRTYSEARPWARAIKQAVVSRKMPPWYADRTLGKFHNDPSLSQREIDILAAWADTGAAAGEPSDAPSPREFVPGWNMGSPDAVFEMPSPYQVPPTATIEYTYVIVPTAFKEDRWITATEFRPGNRAVMHHATVFIRQPGSRWLRDYPIGQPFVPREQIRTAATPTPAATTNAGAGPLEMAIAGYVPGRPPRQLREGYALLIPAGSDLVFQLHYTARSTPESDQSRVGFVFAKDPPRMRVMRIAAFNDRFAIPPGERNHPVSAAVMLGVDSELVDVYPHMHLRGKSMALAAVYPAGNREVILRVPAYDFNWQLNYEISEPKKLPKGTILQAEGVFDNSSANRHNPDPKTEVRWGDQSWEEMMVGFFQVAIPVETDPRTVIARTF